MPDSSGGGAKDAQNRKSLVRTPAGQSVGADTTFFFGNSGTVKQPKILYRKISGRSVEFGINSLDFTLS